MYSFHYQDMQSVLRFRYDNAAHKPALGFQNHKHTPEETIASSIPVLSSVLNEIAGFLIDSY
ncbi:toxin-antitoxin system TumE family protein [Candidatus Electronema sp. PJ]|uniref:toxin-antitoxin system TumE family protein n=1 Tax=Candidatus Electronema sp. PJ TaxID=3401572 RepID=UPI003AA7B10F